MIIKAIKFCRIKFIPVSIFPVIAGYLFAFKNTEMNDFYPLRFMILILTTALIHLFANGINDYFDYKSGLETLIKVELDQKPEDEQGGSKLLTNKVLSLTEARKILIILFLIILILGAYLISIEINMIIFGLIGIVLGYSYTAPPFKFSYRGLGEIIIFICFGLLPFYTGYYLISGEFNLEALLPASLYGLLTVLILYFHHFGHWRQDKKMGKRTIIVIIGTKWGISLYILLLVMIIFLILANVYFQFFNFFALSLIMPVIILIHKLSVIDLEIYEEFYSYLNTVILTNFLISSISIFAIMISSDF